SAGVENGRPAALAAWERTVAGPPGRSELAFEVLESRFVWGYEPRVTGDLRLGSVQGLSVVARLTSTAKAGHPSEATLLLDFRPRGALRSFWEISAQAEIGGPVPDLRPPVPGRS